MTDFTKLDGVGSARGERLEEAGYTMESLARADPEVVAEEADVPEDTALEFIVQAEDYADFEEDEDDSTEDEASTEEEVDETVYEEEIEEDEDDSTEDEASTEEETEEVDEEPSTAVLELDLSGWEEQLLIASLVDMYTEETFRRPEKSRIAKDVLELLEDGVQEFEVDREEANALYYALDRKATEYQGSNEIDMMNTVQSLRSRVDEVRVDL